MELLGLFASQAAIALDLLQRARDAEAALAGDGRFGAVARLTVAFSKLDEEAQPEAERLLEALATVLKS
jgi:hypothetical protein